MTRGGPSGQALADVVKLERLRRLKANELPGQRMWGFYGIYWGFKGVVRFMTLCFKWMLGIKTSIQNNTCIAVRTFGIIHVNICIPGMLHMLYIKFIYICYYIIHTPIAF